MLCCFRRIPLFATLWTIALQAPLSTGISRQEYGSGLPFPSTGHFPNLGIKPTSLTSPALVITMLEITNIATWEALPTPHQHGWWWGGVPIRTHTHTCTH